MESKYVIGIVGLAVVLLLSVSMVAAFGFGKGFMSADLTDEEKAEMQEQREAVQTAISEGDYETWKNLMTSQLTEENFNQMVEHHNKMLEFREAMEKAHETGDFSQMQELHEEYGFQGRHHMGGSGMMGSCPFAK